MTSFALKQTLTKTKSITLTLTSRVPVPTSMLLPLDDESIFTKLNIDQSEIDSANHPLFSIQNADKKDQMKLLVDKVKEKFGRDETDDGSLELKVALLTLRTRNLIRHVQAYPKKRRSLLKQLQAYDIERFEWVCKELNLTYIPYPQYTRPLPKRSKVRGAAITEMLELKESKLNELKQSLAVERKEYYAKKSEIMKAISQHRDELLKEAEELKSSQINTGYPGNSGSKAYDLAHIKIVDKEKWWRKHPEVLKIVYGNRPFKGYK
ncbi:CSF3R [Bugula neritina]|uniref:Small ribosomal subunit protein uS15m n=1 Tax=Bugula neritina TaxID=10212 RepID=A0A7J7KHI6_BUGNE|nr:CSF3R [Bugula neritina]